MATIGNHLIEHLPRQDRQRLRTLCKPVERVMGTVLEVPGMRTRHAYFPLDRKRLDAAACRCYADDRQAYTDVLR